MTATTDPDVFMAALLSRQPALSRLLAISQASHLLRGTSLTVRDLAGAYDRAKAARDRAEFDGVLAWADEASRRTPVWARPVDTRGPWPGDNTEEESS